MLGRKQSVNTPPGSKRNTLKAIGKQKIEDTSQKNGLLMKDLQLTPQQFRKKIASPKDDSIKIHSPVVTGKRYQVGNFPEKTLTKKEIPFFIQVQQRPQTSKKRYNGIDLGEEKVSVSPDLKSPPVGRSSSPKGNYKKGGSLKGFKTKQKGIDALIEKIQILNIEPSMSDTRPQTVDVNEKDRDRSQEAGSKPSKVESKQGSPRVSNH